jgi:hypothetical protein
LRAGMPGVPVYSLLLVCFYHYQAHTRPRVHPQRIIDIAGFLATFGFYPQIYPMSSAPQPAVPARTPQKRRKHRNGQPVISGQRSAGITSH